MTFQDFLILWQDIGLILYSILKAFLPLPSLEVVLVPLVMNTPSKWVLYSLEGALGTFIGGGIGYLIAYKLGRKALQHMASEKDIEKGEEMMEKYGLWAVFIGGITPIPDFLLGYLAGFTRMKFIPFALCDAIARLLRSLMICYMLKSLGHVIDIDKIGTWFSLLIMVWLLIRWWKGKRQMHKENV